MGIQLASSSSRLLQQSGSAARLGAGRRTFTVVAAAGPEARGELREQLPGELLVLRVSVAAAAWCRWVEGYASSPGGVAAEQSSAAHGRGDCCARQPAARPLQQRGLLCLLL
jgi:hypothetical protein